MSQKRKQLKVCGQNEITRDVIMVLFFLSTTFFSKITDTLGDYARFKMKMRSLKKVPGKDSPDSNMNEQLYVPSFTSMLVQLYKETCQDKLAKKPINERQIKQRVKRDLRSVFQSMSHRVTQHLYRDQVNRIHDNEPEGEIIDSNINAEKMAISTRNNAPTPHFIGSLPSSDPRTTSQSGERHDIEQIAIREEEDVAELYRKTEKEPLKLK